MAKSSKVILYRDDGVGTVIRPPKSKPPKRGKWHRVEDELPGIYHAVLVCTDVGIIAIGSIDDNNRWLLTDGARPHITHWRELPNPPKKKAGKDGDF